jgi:hypothetical protein
MLNSYWDIERVLKHNLFNLASKITVSAIIQKKQKLSIEKCLYTLIPEVDSTGNRILESSLIPNGFRFR